MNNASIIIPSNLDNLPFVFAKKYNMNAVVRNAVISNIVNPDASIVPKIATGKPNTRHILNILLPIKLPNIY